MVEVLLVLVFVNVLVHVVVDVDGFNSFQTVQLTNYKHKLFNLLNFKS